MTCWRRLRDWYEAGVWRALHHALLDRLGIAGEIDRSRASIDAQAVPAPGTAERGIESQNAPSGRTRQIARNRARSAMLWSTDEARRSPSA